MIILKELLVWSTIRKEVICLVPFIEGTKLTKLVEGDTVKVEIDGKEESLRLCCLDTEESWSGGSKPVTKAGQLASKWTKQYFGVDDDSSPTGEILINIEFDTKDPVNVCLQKKSRKFRKIDLLYL